MGLSKDSLRFGWVRPLPLTGRGIHLPLEPAVIEKRGFFRRGRAAEHGVAMREAAECADDVGVQLGPFQPICVAFLAKQFDAAFLIVHRLGMLERQIEERAQRGIDARVAVFLNGPQRDIARKRIGREHSWIVAEHVAGELVEHDDERALSDS